MSRKHTEEDRQGVKMVLPHEVHPRLCASHREGGPRPTQKPLIQITRSNWPGHKAGSLSGHSVTLTETAKL